MFICLEQDADLHMAQLMPLPLTVCCFSKIQIRFTFLGPTQVVQEKGPLNVCVFCRTGVMSMLRCVPIVESPASVMPRRWLALCTGSCGRPNSAARPSPACLRSCQRHPPSQALIYMIIYYFTSAAVAVDSSHMTVIIRFVE